VLTPSTSFLYPQVISRTFAYPQVISRTFASFRVLKSSISAGQLHFSTGFDSRQHHRKGRRSAALFLLALSSASRVLRAGGLPGLDGFRSLSALTPVAEGVDGQADQLR
jgi:hypothetical protein